MARLRRSAVALVLWILLFAVPTAAQTIVPPTAITGTGSVAVPMVNVAAIGVTITGSWSGTIGFFRSPDVTCATTSVIPAFQTSDQTTVTTATGNTFVTIGNFGYAFVCIKGGTVTGTATIQVDRGFLSPSAGSGGGGGSGDFTISAYNASFGTAGTADAQVQSVQGIASMTPLQVQSNSANLATESTLASIDGDTGTIASAVITSGTPGINIAGIGGIAPTADLTFDMDSGGGIQNRSAIGIAVPASGGAVQAPGDATYGLATHTPGYSLKRYISVGTTEDESEVKATAGVLVGVSARNVNASAKAHLKCTNATEANTTPGTTAVFYEMLIPAGPGAFIDDNINATFSTALTCYLVLGHANNAVDEVAAGEVSYNLRYRD